MKLLLAAALLFASGCCPSAPAWDASCPVPVLTWEEASAGCAVRDEPYWRCDATWCDVKSSSPPPGVDIAAVSLSLDAFVLANPKCSWINYAYPEVTWIANGSLRPLPEHAPHRVSFDRYKGACGWDDTEVYLTEAYAFARAEKAQPAIVVENDSTVIALARSWMCRNAPDGLVVIWTHGT